MDTSQYDPQAVANADALIQHQLDHDPTIRSRREAIDFLKKVLAQTIANDVVAGLEQWPPRVEQYRYVRDLSDSVWALVGA